MLNGTTTRCGRRTKKSSLRTPVASGEARLSPQEKALENSSFGALLGSLLPEGCEVGNGLDGLPQAHLVSQDNVFALPPGKEQPVKTFELVGEQLPALQEGWSFAVLLDAVFDLSSENTFPAELSRRFGERTRASGPEAQVAR